MQAPLWVFGYGSLIWDPGFPVAERRIAQLAGWHRSFCMRSIHHRGSPESPGLVLALDRRLGATCVGGMMTRLVCAVRRMLIAIAVFSTVLPGSGLAQGAAQPQPGGGALETGLLYDPDDPTAPGLDVWRASLGADDVMEPRSPWEDVPVLEAQEGHGIRLRPWRDRDIEALHRDWKSHSNDGLITLGLGWRGKFRAGPLPENVYRTELDAARTIAGRLPGPPGHPPGPPALRRGAGFRRDHRQAHRVADRAAVPGAHPGLPGSG